MSDSIEQQQKDKIIDELDFLLIMAQKNDPSLIAGLEVAISTIEGMN